MNSQCSQLHILRNRFNFHRYPYKIASLLSIPAVRVGRKLLYFNLTEYTLRSCLPGLLKFLFTGMDLKFVNCGVFIEKLLHDWRYFFVVF